MRLLHTGDTHVGYRQYHSPERRRDFMRAFDQVVEDALAGEYAAVVHAGDLFHDRRPSLVDLQGTIAALRRLDDAGVPFLAVVGNHEGKRDAQWLDLFEDLGLATRLGAEPAVFDAGGDLLAAPGEDVDDGGAVAVYGLDFVPRSRREELDYEFVPPPAGVGHSVLVSHGLFEPFAHADWDTERLLAASTVDFDALLLGDNHAPGREQVGETLVTYCGSTERASASERDERGYNIVDLGERVTVSRRGLQTREFVFVDVTLGEGEGEARVREAVRQYDLGDAVVIVTVEGEGEPISPAAIEELATEAGALVARVNDRREFDAPETTREVSFADPDEAVRERVAEMGLSTAGRDLDDVVRGPTADSNVRGAVERRVREHVEEGVEAFEPADGAGETTESAAGGESDHTPAEATAPETATATDGAGDGEDGNEATGRGGAGDEVGGETAADDGQASMEEYL
jgi:DNA repair exonuclease SbcCD nuclease subunit